MQEHFRPSRSGQLTQMRTEAFSSLPIQWQYQDNSKKDKTQTDKAMSLGRLLAMFPVQPGHTDQQHELSHPAVQVYVPATVSVPDFLTALSRDP